MAEGTTIGYNRLLKFDDINADKVRITVLSTRKTAYISEVGLYYAPEVKGNICVSDVYYVDSSIWSSEIEGADLAFDGDPATEWTDDSLESLQVDMGKVYQISGFVYAPGEDQNLEGTIFRYAFAVSEDGKEWVEVISDGEFSNIMHNPVPYEVYFDAPVSARHFRLTSLQEISDKAMTSIGEINICVN